MSSQIDHLLNENRVFPPSAEFAANAIAQPELYDRADADREAFWAEQSREIITWQKPFTEVLDWSNPPFARWFADGELNVAYNCLDRHVEAGRGDRVAFHFEGEPGDTRTLTYADLTDEVKRLANVLADLGVGEGDRVAIYMPMIPEAVAAMLAVARVGAIHSVVFGGFSADSLRARIDDAGAKLVITADGSYRKGKVSSLKPAVDQALSDDATAISRRSSMCSSCKRGENDVDWVEGRDIWYHDVVTAGIRRPRRPAVPRGESAVHPLHLRNHRKSEGDPAHLRRLSHPGGVHAPERLRSESRDRRFLVHRRYRLDHRPHLRDLRAARQRRHPGALRGNPGLPRPRPLVGSHPEVPREHLLHRADRDPRVHEAGASDPAGLRSVVDPSVLGSVGEPINPEAWMWYRDVVGAGTAPIVDTWWQTETGAIMISPLPGVTETKPGSAQVAAPRHRVDRRRRAGRVGRQRQRRPAGRDRAVAEHAARHLGRP